MDSRTTTAIRLPLLSGLAGCSRCRDTGLWLTPKGIINECPNLQLGFNDHPQANAAAKTILKAGRHLAYRGIIANPISFAVAADLTRHTSGEPATRQDLIDRHLRDIRHSVKREVALVVEELRAIWLLPVASRKAAPHGYWIAVDEADFKEWVRVAVSAPIRQLQTIHAVARANFPEFAGQLELEFWKDSLAPYSTAE